MEKNMYKDIQTFVESCSISAKVALQHVNTRNRVIETNEPNELWECHIIGRFPTMSRGNKLILVAIDHYPKWIETPALKSKDMNSVSQAIEEMIIARHGIPKMILSDNGLESSNTVINGLRDKYGLIWEFNSPGHHSTVRAVERVNQTLLNKVKKLCAFGAYEWDIVLNQAEASVNLSFNRSIQTSPFIFKNR